MKTINVMNKFKSSLFLLFFLFLISGSSVVFANQTISTKGDDDNFSEYKGLVVEHKSGKPLAYANLLIDGTNISTVSNSEGLFSLKVPKEITHPKITVSFIGFKNKSITLTVNNQEMMRVEMESTAVALPEINVITKDADLLIQKVFEKKGENYSNDQAQMTAFYRETIKKNGSYVSLSEAVVEILKQPYSSFRSDAVKLYKARKKADYTKLDTITFKLQGGPFNSLYLDIMKNPDMIFTEKMMENYEFSFDSSTHLDNRLIYILDFKQRASTTEPLYSGKLYIDAQNLALKSAVFSLNVSNRELASQMFILKKPFNANVYPTSASYRIDYLEKDGKWYYGYSRIELSLRVNWKKKLFNTNYHSTIEMAVTDWEINPTKKNLERNERLKTNVIISDEASGFSDPDFWGEYNVIEPEKSIETAIKKIQKKLEKKK